MTTGQVRVNATMAAMAAGLSDEDIADIAAWSSQPTLLGQTLPLELGASLYRGGDEAVDDACRACHSPSGQGNGPAGFALGGQHPEYTLMQLKAFRSGEQTNDNSAMMRTIVERLTDSELEALANYVSGLH